MAQFSYLDSPFPSPFPSLFKEKLFVYLSRFCQSSYCFSRHVAFLHGLGNPAGDPEAEAVSTAEILAMLEVPLPRLGELKEMIGQLESHPLAEGEWVGAHEPALIALASISFRRQVGSIRVEQALARYLGPDRYDRMIAYLGFVQTAHFWTETHLNLVPEDDVSNWLKVEPELAVWVAGNFPARANTDEDGSRAEDQLDHSLDTIAPPIPENESDRLTALRLTGLLDSEPDEDFDDLARMAASICGTPIGLISLVDEHRQWFKGKVGLDVSETPREVSFCAHAICRPGEVLVVPDATQDERFRNNPLVTGEPGIRFYAGVPLLDRNGQALGTLCVIDRESKEFNPEKQRALVALTRQFSLLLELREANSRLSDEIAKRKEHEWQERLRGEAIQDLVENAADLIQSVGPDGRFLYVNSAWRAAMGYGEEEALKLNAFDVIAPEFRDACKNHLQSVMEGKTVGEIDVTFVAKDGKRISLRGNINCRLQEGKSKVTRGIFRPVSVDEKSVADSTDAESFTCVCGWCKQIRDQSGNWVKMEAYLMSQFDLKLTHGICLSCHDEVMADNDPA
jgi:PAS domain S-box-containing protein